MINLRSRLNVISLFSVLFFAASLGGLKGLVLCYGSDGHIHTEITFNGVDCGHFPGALPEQWTPTVLTNSYHTPHTNHCISCIDVPLSLDYSLKKFDTSTNQRKAFKVRALSSLAFTDSSNTALSTSNLLLSHTVKPLLPSLALLHSTVLLL